MVGWDGFLESWFVVFVEGFHAESSSLIIHTSAQEARNLRRKNEILVNEHLELLQQKSKKETGAVLLPVKEHERTTSSDGCYAMYCYVFLWLCNIYIHIRNKKHHSSLEHAHTIRLMSLFHCCSYCRLKLRRARFVRKAKFSNWMTSWRQRIYDYLWANYVGRRNFAAVSQWFQEKHRELKMAEHQRDQVLPFSRCPRNPSRRHHNTKKSLSLHRPAMSRASPLAPPLITFSEAEPIPADAQSWQLPGEERSWKIAKFGKAMHAVVRDMETSTFVQLAGSNWRTDPTL